MYGSEFNYIGISQNNLSMVQLTGSSSSTVNAGSSNSNFMYPFSFVGNQMQAVSVVQFASSSSSASVYPLGFPGNQMKAVQSAAEPLNGFENAGANNLDRIALSSDPIQSAYYQTLLNPPHATQDQTTTDSFQIVNLNNNLQESLPQIGNTFLGGSLLGQVSSVTAPLSHSNTFVSNRLNPIPSNNPVEVIEKDWLRLDKEDFESQLQPYKSKKVLFRHKDSNSDNSFLHVSFKLKLIDINMVGFTKDDLDIQIATVVTKNKDGSTFYYPTGTEEGTTLDKSKDVSVESVNIVIKDWKTHHFKLLGNSQHCKVSWKITVTGKYQHPLNRNVQKWKCVLMTTGIECPNIRSNQPDRNTSRTATKKRRLSGDTNDEEEEQEYTLDVRALTASENPMVQLTTEPSNQTADARVHLGQQIEQTLGARDVLTPTITAGFNAANGVGLLLNEPTNQITRVANHSESQVVRRLTQDSMVDAASDNSVDRLALVFLKLGIDGRPEDEKADRLRYSVSHYWNADDEGRDRMVVFEEILSSLKSTKEMDQVFGKPDDRNDRNSETPIMNAVHARNTEAAIRMIKCLPVDLQREHLMKVTGSNSTILYIACAKTNLEFLTWFNDNHRSILKCPEDMQTLLLKKNNDSRFPRSLTESAYKNKQAREAKGSMNPSEYFKRCDDVYDLIEEWKRTYGIVDDIEPSMVIA